MTCTLSVAGGGPPPPPPPPPSLPPPTSMRTASSLASSERMRRLMASASPARRTVREGLLVAIEDRRPTHVANWETLAAARYRRPGRGGEQTPDSDDDDDDDEENVGLQCSAKTSADTLG